jgi:hypothetical protein
MDGKGTSHYLIVKYTPVVSGETDENYENRQGVVGVQVKILIEHIPNTSQKRTAWAKHAPYIHNNPSWDADNGPRY